MSEGPCTRSNAQVVISEVDDPEDIDVRWASDREIVVSLGSGKLEKSDQTAINGEVTIEYR
ncbi:hypothetical protein [Erythrobacter sp.]|jgi:hypothetical protein|uniref:hypothetical protein n=1 Tax=Erythrobacter sp. TaxID=1042 RepID=UPI002EBFEA08|nr:hypothetical protein [Erythrobacter sp.]